MTDPAQIARLAEGLRRDARRRERYAVMHSEGWQPAFMLAEDNRGATGRAAVVASGLFEKRMGGAQCLHYRLTDLGALVKAHLTAAQEKSCACAAVSESGVALRSPRTSTRKDQA